MTKQGNESAIAFGERCQDLRSLLISRVNSTEETRTIRLEKINMYSRLAVKTFMKGLKEPLSLIVRCRNPRTLEEGLNIIAEENNLTYQRRDIPQNGPLNRPSPSYRPAPPPPLRNAPLTFHRPSIQHPQPRPGNWPTRPNFWQQNRPTQQSTQQTLARPNNQGQQPYKPTPMDTSSGNTRRTVQPPSTSQRFPVQQFPRYQPIQRNPWTTQELNYQEEFPYVPEDNQYNQYYATQHDEIENQYDQFENQSIPHMVQYEEQHHVAEEMLIPENFEPSTENAENQDFYVIGPDKSTL